MRFQLEGVDCAGGESGSAGGLERHLVVLMGARLGLALLSLGLVLAFDATAGSANVPNRWALYATVAAAFMATLSYGLFIQRIKRTRPFAAANLVMDFAVVTALVQFSGGTDSALTFLYVLVAVYGAVLFDLRGAVVATCLGGLSYGGLLFAGMRGWIPPNPSAIPQPTSVLFTLWLTHAGALVVATTLGRFLASELRRTGEALSQRTSDFNDLWSLHRRTVESLMSGLLTTDARGAITSFNPEAVRITAVGSEMALGRPVEEILPGIWECVAGGVGEGALRSRARMPYQNRLGEEVFLGVAAYALMESGNNANGQVVIFQDVTDVVAMERDLWRSERLAAVGELSASIAHEIRNPLAAISGSIQILQEKLRSFCDEEDSSRLMEIVVRETDRLNLLIGDFLHFARPGPLRLDAVDVLGLIEEVLETFEAARPEAVRIEMAVPAQLFVNADPGQLRQVLWNLLQNSVQAMPEGGALRITARPMSEAGPQGVGSSLRREAREKKSWVEICLADEGTGIAADVLDHIFDPFFTTKSEGSGLGLPTVHRIVEGHGGLVRVESRPGEGTSILLRMPRVESAE